MSLLDRILRRAPAGETRRGWGDGAWGVGYGLGTGAYHHRRVVPALAESLAAVLGAVELISGSIASMPASLVVDTPDGRQPAPQTAPAWGLLARPNPRLSWPSYMAWLVGELLLRGNAISMVQVDGRGAVSSLVPVPWAWLQPMVVAGGSGPRLVFDLWQHILGEAELLGLPDRLLEEDVLHVKARSDHGVLGRSVIARASGPVREGLEIMTLAEANWRRGTRPSGVISAPTFLTDQQRDRFRASFRDDFEGAVNAGRTVMLEGGWSYTPHTISTVDAEFLASRQFHVADVARMFAVPEPMLQLGPRVPADLAPYVTAFAQLALAPIVGAIEAEFDHAVLPAGMHLAIDMAGLMRGSFSAQTAAMAALVQSGIVSPNDAREQLGWPRVDGGDQLGTKPAPSWPADASGMPHLGPSPGPTGAGVPNVDTNQNQGSAA